MLSCAVSGILFANGVGFFSKPVADPTIVVNQYYSAVEKQDYSTAYSYLAPNRITTNGQAVTQESYTSAAQALDTTKGNVTNYSIGNISYNFDINDHNTETASVTVTVTRANGSSYDVHLKLQQVNVSWIIISSDNI